MDKLRLLEAVGNIMTAIYDGEGYASIEADIRLLPMLKEYREIISRGEKKSYATYYLAEKYAISERTIRRAVRRLNL